MSEIYIVTKGEYSDYGIEGVFDSREAAENFAQQWTDSQVETHELNPVNPYQDKMANGLFPYYTCMGKDGEGYAHRVDFDDLDNRRHTEFIYNDKLSLYTFAKDKDHALKIANEKRGMILASGQWNDDYGFLM